MLAQAEVADVIMAPAADMFELGVKVQVLKRGTMFGVRAAKLYDAFVEVSRRSTAIPAAERAEARGRRAAPDLRRIWDDTKPSGRSAIPLRSTALRGRPERKMALVFRWYLGKASKWAIDGEPSRRADYQVWCGPAMGAFNAWTKGTFLAEPGNRTVVQIGSTSSKGPRWSPAPSSSARTASPCRRTPSTFRPRLLG
jgi:trans-AT polyketide synthase/acyltransferase/oxidoreductase domain-containing protein